MKRPVSMPYWPERCSGSDQFGPSIIGEADSGVMAATKRLCGLKKEGLIDFTSAHDDDLFPFDPKNPFDYLNPNSPIHSQLWGIKKLLDKAGLQFHMITCSLHGPAFCANGGFTNADPKKRWLATQKALRAAWIGNFFGAETVTYWVARDGFESTLSTPFYKLNKRRPQDDPLRWIANALDMVSFACAHNNYSITQGTIEVKANEPRGINYLPFNAAALMLIDELNNPDFWGLNNEVPQHAGMASQSPFLEIVHAVRRNKLLFMHFGGQYQGQFDNDTPFLYGMGFYKEMIMILCYLEAAGWKGKMELDCKPPRTDLAPGSENAEEAFYQFAKDNVETYRAFEGIVVPRILESEELQAAQNAIWAPSHSSQSELDLYADILDEKPSAEKLRKLMTMTIDADAVTSCRANCTAVEKVVNFAIANLKK
jgi:hypothetical protein